MNFYRSLKIILLWMNALMIISCSECRDDELLRDKVELKDGSHIMVYHNSLCSDVKPLFYFSLKDNQLIPLKMPFAP